MSQNSIMWSGVFFSFFSFPCNTGGTWRTHGYRRRGARQVGGNKRNKLEGVSRATRARKREGAQKQHVLGETESAMLCSWLIQSLSQRGPRVRGPYLLCNQWTVANKNKITRRYNATTSRWHFSALTFLAPRPSAPHPALPAPPTASFRVSSPRLRNFRVRSAREMPSRLHPFCPDFHALGLFRTICRLFIKFKSSNFLLIGSSFCINNLCGVNALNTWNIRQQSSSYMCLGFAI